MHDDAVLAAEAASLQYRISMVAAFLLVAEVTGRAGGLFVSIGGLGGIPQWLKNVQRHRPLHVAKFYI